MEKPVSLPTAREETRPFTLFPACRACNLGVLVPLSDYGQEGASVIFKAWACSTPSCEFTLRIDKGEVSRGRQRNGEPRRHAG